MKKYFTLDEWVKLLRKLGKENGSILSPGTLRAASGLSLTAVRKAIQRLGEKGYLKKLAGRFYANTFFLPSLNEAAMLLGRPCYISFESALEKHGIISQMPLVLTCATTRKTRKISTPLGEIFFHHIQLSLFGDYDNEQGILWARPEKALLDYVYMNLKIRKGVMPLDEFDLKKINPHRLKKLSSMYPGSVAREAIFIAGLSAGQQ